MDRGENNPPILQNQFHRAIRILDDIINFALLDHGHMHVQIPTGAVLGGDHVNLVSGDNAFKVTHL